MGLRREVMPHFREGMQTMRTRVKDYIEVSDHTSLDRLITTLVAIRDSLPAGAEPEIKLRGDDVFGRRLSISYNRELKAEEAAAAVRYVDDKAVGEELAQIAAKLDQVPFEQRVARKAA